MGDQSALVLLNEASRRKTQGQGAFPTVLVYIRIPLPLYLSLEPYEFDARIVEHPQRTSATSCPISTGRTCGRWCPEVGISGRQGQERRCQTMSPPARARSWVKLFRMSEMGKECTLVDQPCSCCEG